MFCVTATNVGSGLSVKAYIGGQAVSVIITHDPATHTATICLKVPKGAKGGIEVLASDSNSPGYVSHNALIRK